MEHLYGTYINQIRKALAVKDGTKNFSQPLPFGQQSDLIKSLMLENKTLEPKTGLHKLAELLGIPEVKKPYKGDHPDFTNLRISPGVDYHYIVSMFIDVKGSTNFHKKYDLEQIALIIQTIVVAATHTISLFGGHIQRLQYDGVFCYFGGRKINKEDAIISALNAASFFSYFIKYELRELFQFEGIENVFTRVGIDFGDDKDVQWIIFGSDNCDELTTNSLYTSLVPKMQANAKINGIMIGQNVKNRMGKLELFTDLLRDEKGNVDEEKRYIYKDPNKNFYYTQYLFEWPAYLKESFWFIKKNNDGNLYIDYNASPRQNLEDQKRLENLYRKTTAISSGVASLNKNAQLQSHPNGIKIPENKFYHGNGLEI